MAAKWLPSHKGSAVFMTPSEQVISKGPSRYDMVFQQHNRQLWVEHSSESSCLEDPVHVSAVKKKKKKN